MNFIKSSSHHINFDQIAYITLHPATPGEPAHYGNAAEKPRNEWLFIRFSGGAELSLYQDIDAIKTALGVS